MKYKFSYKEANKIEKFGVNMSIFNTSVETCNVVYEEVEKGHFEEFYSDRSTYMWFIIEGSGLFVIDDEKIEVGEKDLVVVPPQKRIYYLGKMKMILCVTPAFDEKHEHHVRNVDPDENP